MAKKVQNTSSSSCTEAAQVAHSDATLTKTAGLDPLWSARRITEFLAISISTLRRWISGGSFPEGFWIGKNIANKEERIVKKFANKEERKVFKYAQLV